MLSAKAGQPSRHPQPISDRMHAPLVTRADALEGCTEGSPEEAVALADAIEAYEAVRYAAGQSILRRRKRP